jgi:hypothetical protein
MADFTQRMIGAATLDMLTYEEVEYDRTATRQAAAVVTLVAVSRGIGSVGPPDVVYALVNCFVGWFFWTAISLFVGTRIFSGVGDWGQMLRTLGFAYAPGVLFILGIIPTVGRFVEVPVGIWMLACGVIAVRQAMDLSTDAAIGTVALAWLGEQMVFLTLQAVMGLR